MVIIRLDFTQNPAIYIYIYIYICNSITLENILDGCGLIINL